MDNILTNKWSSERYPVDVQAALADRVRTLRKAKKWSQSEMARRSGVSLGSLKRFENTGKVSLNSLLKMVHVLDRLSEFEELLLIDTKLEIVQKRMDELLGK